MLNPGIDLLHEGLESLLNEILTVHTVDCQVVACALRELLLGLAGPSGNATDTNQLFSIPKCLFYFRNVIPTPKI
jgi:hypothetical protein